MRSIHILNLFLTQLENTNSDICLRKNKKILSSFYILNSYFAQPENIVIKSLKSFQQYTKCLI